MIHSTDLDLTDLDLTELDRTSPGVARAIAAATDRIAPTWPLDQFIAVNPYWGWRHEPIGAAAARLGVLAGTGLTMPRSWYRSERNAGRLTGASVAAAATGSGDPALATAAERVLAEPLEHAAAPSVRMALITDLRDHDRSGGPRSGLRWTEHVTHQISQHCAAHFDRWQGTWHADQTTSLFAGWRAQMGDAPGLRGGHGRRWVRSQLATLPAAADAAIETMLRDLRIPLAGHEAYLTSLLLSINGWAAWCAYQRWQARLADRDDDDIVELLAIRLAWEWLLRNDAADDADAEAAPARSARTIVGPTVDWAAWAASWAHVDELAARLADEQRLDWVLQTALERTYQDELIGAFRRAEGAAPVRPALDHPSPDRRPAVQAVFCIDVRSEVMRRALEAVTADVHTSGLAGFFGLPISYTPAGSSLTRPQLPGLLAPALHVTDRPAAAGPAVADPTAADLATQRRARLGAAQRWHHFRHAPSSIFTFVESMGLLYGPKLVKDSLAHRQVPPAWEHDGLDANTRAGLRPRLGLVEDDPAAAAALAHKVLRAMGLVEGFAPLVLLCGHGSRTENNPHAAALGCGACGGQSGEVNARVLADVLNAPAVRDELRALGIDVPSATWFVPGLHDTMTDQVQLFDTDLLPEELQPAVTQLQRWLAAAGERARAERAPGLGLGPLVAQPERLERALLERAGDWSQTRPEWGLAGNASFVVAPRRRTLGVDLGGQAFLHDYDWRLDPDLSVLTLLMTAPMVVTNWINLQYGASTVDNVRYGSGNKVLHNVMGGRIGVFEGNGGDLRIGLPLQCLHDGEQLRHRPLRLSVFIEAPRHGIDHVIDTQPVVHDLVANGWLHLLRIEPATGAVERWTAAGWEPQPAGTDAA